MEEDKDIKILEEYLDKQDRKFVSEYRLMILQAVENLIARYKELEKEYERVKEGRNWYFEHYTSQACTPEQLHKILKFDYIPKSKVKEKIEELEPLVNKYDEQMANDEDTDLSYDEVREYACKIEAWRELLED